MKNRIIIVLVLTALAVSTYFTGFARDSVWYGEWETFGGGITAEEVQNGIIQVNIENDGAQYRQKNKTELVKNRLYKISAQIKPSHELINAAVPIYFETEYFDGYGEGGNIEFERKPIMGIADSADLTEDWNTLTAYYRYNGVQSSGKTRIAIGINGGFMPSGCSRISYQMKNFKLEECTEDIFNVRNEASAWVFNDNYDTYAKNSDGYVTIYSDNVCAKAYQPILIDKNTEYTAVLKVRTDKDAKGGLYIDNRGFGDSDITNIITDAEFKANEWTEIYTKFKYQKTAENGGGNIYLKFDEDISRYDIADFKVFSASPKILNPDFSQGIKFWNVSAKSVTVSEETERYIEIVPNDNSSCQIAQPITLEKNKWYILYAKVKVNENDSSITPTVKFHMVNYHAGENLGATYVTPGEWTEVYTCFKYTGTEKNANFILRAGQDSSGATQYDSVKNGIKIAYAGIIEKDNSRLIINGDFEDKYLLLGTSAYTAVNEWHNNGNVFVDPFWYVQPDNIFADRQRKVSYEKNQLGNNSCFAKITSNTWTNLTQSTDVKNGKKYMVTADARAVNNNADGISTQIFVFLGSGYTESQKASIDGKKWRRNAYLFTADSDTVRPELRYGQFGGADFIKDGVCVDNFNMVEVDNYYANIECINSDGVSDSEYDDKIRTRLTFANCLDTDLEINYIVAQYSQDGTLCAVKDEKINAVSGKAFAKDFEYEISEKCAYAKGFVFNGELVPLGAEKDLLKKGDK